MTRNMRILPNARENRIERRILRNFNVQMRAQKIRCQKLNAPIAKYDVKLRKAYLEYPDGRKVYDTKEKA